MEIDHGLSRRKFTKEFKEEAVRRLELGVSLAEVSRACEGEPERVAPLAPELRDYESKLSAAMVRAA